MLFKLNKIIAFKGREKLVRLLIVSALLIILQSNLFGQSKKNDFQKQRDSLLVLKKSMQTETAQLKAEIKHLREKLDKISSKYGNKKIVLFIKRYGRKSGQRVAAGKIWKGMTLRMMKDSWGKPDKVRENKEKWGVFTQWTFGKITYFFRDGKLTDWEEKK